MQYSIQYLRAVAAIMVVIFHCFYSVEFMRANVDHVGWLRSGVDIFFVISGYVMVDSTAGRQIKPTAFAFRRIVRILPLYWLASAIMAIAVLPGEWFYKIGSLLFLPVAHPETGMIEPLVQPGWTLNYEMFFYALFAATLALHERWRLPAMAGILASLVALGSLFGASGAAGFYSNSIMLEFVFGMALRHFGIRLHWLCIPLGFAAMAALNFSEAPRAITFGLPAAAVVAGFLSIEERLPRWSSLRLIGDASYAIYLFQIILLAMILLAWTAAGSAGLWFAPIAVAAIVIGGLAIHLLIERPIMELSKKLLTRRANAQPDSPAMPAPSPTVL